MPKPFDDSARGYERGSCTYDQRMARIARDYPQPTRGEAAKAIENTAKIIEYGSRSDHLIASLWRNKAERE